MISYSSPPRTSHPASSSDITLAEIASKVHQVIRDGTFTLLPTLIQDGNENNILWQPNASGWTTVHYAVSHFLPLEWLEWILERSTEPKNFFTVQTSLGQTVLDVFFCSYWDPLPWQSTAVRLAAKRLIQSVHVVSNHKVLLQAVCDSLPLSSSSSFSSPCCCTILRTRSGRRRRPLLTTAVYRVQRFLTRLILLCRAAASTKTASSSAEDDDDDSSSLQWILAILADNGYCPPAVVRLLLALGRVVREDNAVVMDCCICSSSISSEQETNSASTGTNSSNNIQSPLHIWASSRTHHSSIHPDPMLPALIEAYPSDTACAFGLAVASGKPWSHMKTLYTTTTASTSTKTTTTMTTTMTVAGTPLFVVATLAALPDFRLRARQQAAGRWLVPISQQFEDLVLDVVQRTYACEERLTTIYELLRADPPALHQAARTHAAAAAATALDA